MLIGLLKSKILRMQIKEQRYKYSLLYSRKFKWGHVFLQKKTVASEQIYITDTKKKNSHTEDDMQLNKLI